MRKALLYFIIAVVTASNCTNNNNNSFRFINATSNEYAEERRPIADTFFHHSIPIYSEADKQFVYVTNPDCSFCIASAISCCNARSSTCSESPFIFLIKSDYTELFEFYLDRDCKIKVPFITTEDCNDLQDGLYTIRNRYVTSYSKWNP